MSTHPGKSVRSHDIERARRRRFAFTWNRQLSLSLQEGGVGIDELLRLRGPTSLLASSVSLIEHRTRQSAYAYVDVTHTDTARHRESRKMPLGTSLVNANCTG